jgi:hypothetical protein
MRVDARLHVIYELIIGNSVTTPVYRALEHLLIQNTHYEQVDGNKSYAVTVRTSADYRLICLAAAGLAVKCKTSLGSASIRFYNYVIAYFADELLFKPIYGQLLE